ncbi:MAG: PadR family transcriptional regulator [Solirubrobacteraceae bacterium]
MKGASTPLRGALLGLVLERPGHGGELAHRLRIRLGESWRVDGNDVYRLLEGLEREGLLAGVEQSIRGRRGSRVVYEPTAQTAAAVRDWMQTLLPREPIRRGIEAKLAVATEDDAASIRIALRQYERECLELVQAIVPSAREPRTWTQLFLDCTREGVLRCLQAEIEWAGRTVTRIEQYAQRQRR